MRCLAQTTRYGRIRRLTWPAKPPFPASILMSGTGPPVFTASGGPTPGARSEFPTDSLRAQPKPARHPRSGNPGATLQSNGKTSDCPNPGRAIAGLRAKRAGFSSSAPCLARHPRLEHAPTTGPRPDLGAFRRGGRVVECTALEMRHRCKPIGGSNPSLSAIIKRLRESPVK